MSRRTSAPSFLLFQPPEAKGEDKETGIELVSDLRKFLDDPNLSDVTFIVEDEEFHCIRALMCRCPFFYSMLTTQDLACDKDSRMLLPHVKASAFRILREFLYTGELQSVFDVPCSMIPSEDRFVTEVVDALTAADFFQLPELARILTSAAISCYIQGRVNPFWLYESISACEGKESFRHLLVHLRCRLSCYADWFKRYCPPPGTASSSCSPLSSWHPPGTEAATEPSTSTAATASGDSGATEPRQQTDGGTGQTPLCACMSAATLAEVIKIMRSDSAQEELLFEGLRLWCDHHGGRSSASGGIIREDGAAEDEVASTGPGSDAKAPLEPVLRNLFGAAECSKMPVTFVRDAVAPSGLVHLSVIQEVLLDQLLLAERLGVCFKSRTNLVAKDLLRQSYATWSIHNVSSESLIWFCNQQNGGKSPPLCLDGRIWRLMLTWTRDTEMVQLAPVHHLGLFLCPQEPMAERGSRQHLSVQVAVLNSDHSKHEVVPDGGAPATLKFANPDDETGRGFANLMKGQVLLDPQEGFVSHNLHVLRIQVRIIKRLIQPEGFLWPPEEGVQVKTSLA